MITDYSLYRYGNNRCDLILISYGSSALSASVASKLLNEKGYKTCLLKIKSLYPINEASLKNLTEEASKIFVVENNMGLYYREIRGVLRNKDVRSVSIIDLHIIDPYEIVEEVLKSL
jgi:pyruvate/2-oxoacid:ferredoxin oxidoreductase alpha subunit